MLRALLAEAGASRDGHSWYVVLPVMTVLVALEQESHSFAAGRWMLMLGGLQVALAMDSGCANGYCRLCTSELLAGT